MPEEQAPPVVAVVVASDPGPWFEESLEALAAQDYPNLDVLVIDAASTEQLTTRIAAVLPRAFVRRLPENRGFSASSNEALAAVAGATHLLICHDDVALAPDAVRRLVEEAYRSNAGVVGPKFVEWDAPDRLLQVGLGVDRFGAPVPRTEPGELDQAQHDEVREVFAVPGGCTLVRSDLFAALGGFDPEIELFGEDVDFCWRAQVAGARVVIVPSAVARHRQAAASRVRPGLDIAGMRRRHALRAVLKNYGLARRLAVEVQLAVASIVAVLVGLAKSDRGRARCELRGWWWNLSRKSLREARAGLRAVRQRPDKAVVRQFSRPSRRPAEGEPSALEPGARGEDERWASLASGAGSGRSRLSASQRWTLTAVLITVVTAFGIRNLVFGRLPLVGQLLPLPGPGSLLAHFLGGWQDAGWQTTGPAPSAFGLIGTGSAVLLGSSGLLERLLLVAPIAIGAVGIYRLLRPFGSTGACFTAAVAYLGFPLVWNDMGAGDLQALAAYAAMPFVLARLARASRLEPFEPPPGLGRWRSLAADVVPFGLLLAVLGALSPPALVAVVALVVGLVLGSLAAGAVRGALRAGAAALGALVVAFCCLFPWSLTFVQPGAQWSVLGRTVGAPGSQVGIAKMLRLAVGPVGAGWLGWGLVVAAGFVLLVARGPRLSWATRWWVAAVTTVVVAYGGAVGWLGQGGGATRVLLAPAACCLAAAVGLGVAAFEVDLAKTRFGWRQALSAAAAVGLVLGLLPTLVSTVDGRSSLPSVGYRQVLGWTAAGARSVPYRVLWLGAPEAVPAPSWQIRRGLVYAVSLDGLPDGTRLWPSANPGVGSRVAADLAAAVSGATVRLGAALSQLGVRYVVVPNGVAPALPGVQAPPPAPPPSMLTAALQAQSDLLQLPTEGGVLAFRNTAWPAPGSGRNGAVPALASDSGGTPAALRTLGVLAGLVAVALALSEGVRRRRRRHRGAGAVGVNADATCVNTGAADVNADVKSPGSRDATGERLPEPPEATSCDPAPAVVGADAGEPAPDGSLLSAAGGAPSLPTGSERHR